MDARHRQPAALLPAAPPGTLQVRAAFPADAAAGRVEARSRPGPAGVLLGEDDRKLAGVLMRALGATGFAVTLVDTGSRALEAMGDAPDVAAIVLDIMIPRPDGIEVCRQLRHAGWQGGVVLISALDGPDTRQRARAAGADLFLSKPFPLRELVDAVTTLVDGPNRQDTGSMR